MDEVANGDEKISSRLKRIDRWIKRCAAACSGKRYSSALMDIECAKAEADIVRGEIWSAAEEQNGVEKKRHRSRLGKFARVGALAAAMLLFIGLPISNKDPLDGGVGVGSIELLTNSESRLIGELRRSLSNSNRSRVIIAVEPLAEIDSVFGTAMALASQLPERPIRVIDSASTSSEKRRAREAVKAVHKEKTDHAAIETAAAKEKIEKIKTEEKNIQAREAAFGAEDMLSLLQIGERALRVPGAAVKIIR